MRRSISTLLLLAVIATGAAACDDNNTPTTPNIPNNPGAPLTFTETFTGAINRNGAATSNFTAATLGTVTATLTTVSDASIAVGISLGTWTGSACQVVIANDNALQGAIITGTVTSAASLCVRIYDVGKVASSVNYTITVVRPSLTGTD